MSARICKRSARPRRAVTSLLAAVWLLAPAALPAADADVRLLIDVSGSMKQTDPQNLRVPALRLVSELLPAGAVAGVWLFAEDAAVLVEPGVVDEGWRETAREQVGAIHSRGLYTHIEAALDAATAGWEAEATHPPRHIVLLTDGRVDVSPRAEESAASRDRLVSGVLERLRSYGASVHAVALSDDVDHDLLDILTGTTGGLLEKAADAEQLQRVFLYMLEQSAAPVTVPLEGRRFTIDASVSELTLLVFRGNEEAVRLYSPADEVYTAETRSDNVSWLHALGYDLVTVTAPPPGEWRFDGAEDPDNRAVVVTNLTLETNTIPGTLMSSEVADLDAWLNENGERLERLEMLRVVQPTLMIDGDAIEPAAGEMLLDEERYTFEGRLDGRALPPGDYQLSFTLDGGTFRRQVNRRLRFLGDPLTVSYTEEAADTDTDTDTATDTVIVDVTPDSDLVRGDTLSGFITVTDAAGLVRAFPLPEITGGVSRIAIPASAAGEHLFEPHLYFTTRHGRSLRLSPTAQAFELDHAASTEPEVPIAVPPPVAEFSALRTVVIVVLGNALAALGFVVLFLLYRARPVPMPDVAGEAA